MNALSIVSRRVCLVLATMLLFGSHALSAETPTVTEILEKASANQDKMDEAIEQRYTWREHKEIKDANEHAKVGKTRQNRDYEILFVGKYRYKKMVLRNGRQLPKWEAEWEESHFKKTAAAWQKGKVSPDKPPYQPIIEWCELADILRLMDSTLLREEEIDGRKTWVIESRPRKDVTPTNSADRTILRYRHLLWIDEQDFALVRHELFLPGDGRTFSASPNIRWTYAKQDGMWLPQSSYEFHTRQAVPNNYKSALHPSGPPQTWAEEVPASVFSSAVLDFGVITTKFYDYKIVR